MTISDMTNEQLDKLIAEKRGYVLTGYGMWTPPGKQENFDNFILGLPGFTTDPRYAMELLKEMVDTGNTIVIFKEGNKYTLDGEADNCVGVADTPERAIAEAWLQWRENE